MTRVVVREESTLLNALVTEGGFAKKTAKARLASGVVHVNGVATTRGGHRVVVGDQIEIGTPRPRMSMGVVVLYEDDELIVIDKPTGLLSVPASTSGYSKTEKTAESAVEAYLGSRPWRVHRLDRETSGVLILAKRRDVEQHLEANWRSFQKHYLAITSPPPDPAAGTIDIPLRELPTLEVVIDESLRGERDAISHYETLETRGRRALVAVRIDTGRKHQVRVHLAHVGAPIVGDKRYSKVSGPRLFLHAHRLRFQNPAGKWIEVEAPMPGSFRGT